jgi:hypothetical protein
MSWRQAAPRALGLEQPVRDFAKHQRVDKAWHVIIMIYFCGHLNFPTSSPRTVQPFRSDRPNNSK